MFLKITFFKPTLIFGLYRDFFFNFRRIKLERFCFLIGSISELLKFRPV